MKEKNLKKIITNPFREGFSKNLIVLFFIITIMLSLSFVLESLYLDTSFTFYIEKFGLSFLIGEIIAIFIISKKYKLDLSLFFYNNNKFFSLKSIKEIILPSYFILILLFIVFFISFVTNILDFNDYSIELIELSKFRLLKTSEPNFIIHNIFFLFVSCILFPVIEEIIFRGFLLTRFSIKSNVEDGMIASSILFGLYRYDSFIIYFFIGYIYSHLYFRNKTLIYPILVHSLFNLFCIIFEYYFSEINLFLFLSNYSLIFIICSILIVIFNLKFIKSFFEDTFKLINNLKEVPYFENYKKKYSYDSIFVYTNNKKI